MAKIVKKEETPIEQKIREEVLPKRLEIVIKDKSLYEEHKKLMQLRTELEFDDIDLIFNLINSEMEDVENIDGNLLCELLWGAENIITSINIDVGNIHSMDQDMYRKFISSLADYIPKMKNLKQLKVPDLTQELLNASQDIEINELIIETVYSLESSVLKEFLRTNTSLRKVSLGLVLSESMNTVSTENELIKLAFTYPHLQFKMTDSFNIPGIHKIEEGRKDLPWKAYCNDMKVVALQMVEKSFLPHHIVRGIWDLAGFPIPQEDEQSEEGVMDEMLKFGMTKYNSVELGRRQDWNPFKTLREIAMEVLDLQEGGEGTFTIQPNLMEYRFTSECDELEDINLIGDVEQSIAGG